jgi:hypothetical protein
MLVFYIVPMNALVLIACLFMSALFYLSLVFLSEECYRLNGALLPLYNAACTVFVFFH